MATQTPPTETMKLDRTDGSSTLELYRAALGPLRRDYYLKAFTRFDAVGKAGPSWNWVAAFLTINWLGFRKLWAAALAYVGALVFSALLLSGIGRVLFHLDDTTLLALAGLTLIASILIPGMFGNAWLYAALNKKIEKALVDSATLEEACAALTPEAGGRNRLAGVAGANLVLCATAAAFAYFLPDSGSLPLKTTKMVEARVTPAEQVQSGLARAATTASSAPQAVASAGVASAQVLPATPTNEEAIANAARVSKGTVQPASPPTPMTPAAAPVGEASAPATVAAGKEVRPEPKPVLETPVAKVDKAMPVSKVDATPKSEKVEKTPKAVAKDKKPASEAHKKSEKGKSTQESAISKPPVAPASDQFLINVGLFADSNNARNAIAKLTDAGLPVVSSTLKSSKGERTRVRVGPFETQAEADRTVEKIQAMKLEAVVVKP